MNIERFNQWTTLASNMGVLFGIAILVIEINQNTIATESEVTWTHTNAAYDIYYTRVENPELLQLLLKMRSLSEDELQKLRDEQDFELSQARIMVGTEFGYWQSRYLTQTSAEERKILENHMRQNGSFPIYRFALENAFGNFYHDEFLEFAKNILSVSN